MHLPRTLGQFFWLDFPWERPGAALWARSWLWPHLGGRVRPQCPPFSPVAVSPVVARPMAPPQPHTQPTAPADSCGADGHLWPSPCQWQWFLSLLGRPLLHRHPCGLLISGSKPGQGSCWHEVGRGARERVSRDHVLPPGDDWGKRGKGASG